MQQILRSFFAGFALLCLWALAVPAQATNTASITVSRFTRGSYWIDTVQADWSASFPSGGPGHHGYLAIVYDNVNFDVFTGTGVYSMSTGCPVDVVGGDVVVSDGASHTGRIIHSVLINDVKADAQAAAQQQADMSGIWPIFSVTVTYIAWHYEFRAWADDLPKTWEDVSPLDNDLDAVSSNLDESP